MVKMLLEGAAKGRIGGDAMKMATVMNQRLEQRLRMTSQMIQSIEMLQLPLMVLQEHINQELVNNPCLEVDEREREVDEREALREEKEEAETDFERLEDMEREYGESFRGDDIARRYEGEEDSKLDAMQNTAAPPLTLREHLENQLRLSKESDRLKELAALIVGNLSDDGYLRVPLPECFRREEGGKVEQLVEPPPTDEEMEEALLLVQRLDPPGVGARSVEECLIIQLRNLPRDTSFEEELIEKHLDDLCNNRLPKIAKEKNIPVERIKEALKLISRLNPRPGSRYGDRRAQYIVPDVIVEEADGEFVVRLNERGLPRLKVSNLYKSMLEKEEKGSPSREFLREKLNRAQWLIQIIEQRRNTLYKIARQIVEIQKDFFENGPACLKPLMQQEVADRIGMHVSTVSRALAGKYMQTPWGLFPMKYFFTSGFETADGDAESNRAVMLKIRELVAAEDPRNPLSDQEIVKRIRAAGTNIARRTVAKYREKMGIPSSRQRKAY
ncbi:MAG: RNA polymerase factor sigma-54 [Planctomycetota bacterium]|nr:RNA polymerase factor sigma-54 [Planctomycetota bacterium]